VEIVPRTRVEALEIQEGVLTGVLVAGPRRRIATRSVIIATGGQSYPATGSTGDGFRFAEAAGHRLAPLRPSLVGIATRPAYEGAQGLTVKNVNLTLWIDGRKDASEFGEAEFTARGLGGAIVLRLSRRIVEALAAGRRAEVTLDLKPALDLPKLEARLLRDLEAHGRDTCRNLLRTLLPAQLVEVFLEALALEPGVPAAQLHPRRKKLMNLLKELRFEVTGHGSWEEAIVTAGGVLLKEVDPRTLASRKVAGLYFAGEVLDLDANTGGYNLQIAFSTGWLAGEAAARAGQAAPSPRD
jgi:hypothetical protein